MDLRTSLQTHIFICRTLKFFGHLFNSRTEWREYGIVFYGLVHLVFELAERNGIISIHRRIIFVMLLGYSS